jgi:hypothetical protein
VPLARACSRGAASWRGNAVATAPPIALSEAQKVLVGSLILVGEAANSHFGQRLDRRALAGPVAFHGGDHFERRRAPPACDDRVRGA